MRAKREREKEAERKKKGESKISLVANFRTTREVVESGSQWFLEKK